MDITRSTVFTYDSVPEHAISKKLLDRIDSLEKKLERLDKGNKPMESKVSEETINDLIANSDVDVETIFDKVTRVSIKLPNGFVLTETSGAVSSENYDKNIGFEICMEQIKHRLWELEGYKLASSIY
ncbi:Gp49 family protein [Weissella koreensis]|uniref:Gp49 family protein n=1 Tax=Weissella koreensis TaxID=165096 RepID=UPI0022BA2BEC|nr:Gp49 family protein [Weissella koreensis]MCZ9310621.1 Gp49 family protein [Weissella koreensis]